MFREQPLRTAGPIHDPAQEPGAATAGLPRLLPDQVTAGPPAAAVRTEVIHLLLGAVRTAAIRRQGAQAAADRAIAPQEAQAVAADHRAEVPPAPAAVAQDLHAVAEEEADNIIKEFCISAELLFTFT